MISVVYKFTHLPTGKIYIGSLKDSRRFEKYTTSSTVVSNMYKENPKEWVKEILSTFEDTEFSKVVEIEHRVIKLVVEEDGWGKLFNQFYMRETARVYSPSSDGKRFARLRSDEVRKRISETLKKHFETNPNPMQGRKHNEVSRKKLSESHMGKTVPPEVRLKMSISHKKRLESLK